MKKVLRWLARQGGYEIINLRSPSAGTSLPYDFTVDEIAVYARVRPYTQTSPERVITLMRAVRHVVEAAIPGALVECGVWKGGSAMAMALSLQQQKAERDLYLYDVFGPIPQTVEQDGAWVNEAWQKYNTGELKWEEAPSLATVRSNLSSNGCDLSRVRFVKGKVEDTVPKEAPDAISLLRIDTDFYESTRHELQHLFPLLSPGGILIIDDYIPFPGCRKAVDEYFADYRPKVFLQRIDADSRLIIKPA